MNGKSPNASLLLVDDEKDLVEIGSEMLKRLGYRVTAITGSINALEVFQGGPDRIHPDL